jgi:hypothetical protein
MTEDEKPEFVQPEPDELQEDQLDQIAGAGDRTQCSGTLVHDAMMTPAGC